MGKHRLARAGVVHTAGRRHVHGLQQSPAMGRGLAEMLVHGEYRSLDLSEFSYDRVIRNEAIVERAVI